MPAELERPDRVLAVAPAWIEAHAVVPDGFRRGAPFSLYDFQLEYMAGFYTVRGDVAFDPVRPILAPAFRNSRGLLVGPQKLGKSPFSASHVALEAVGPTVFCGWAVGGELYACADWGCGCGWTYAYEPGEPMGMPRPTPKIQLVAVSEDQTGNIYDALRPMIDLGPLRFLLPKTGEDFIRLPGGGTIDTVTSNASSRQGEPATFAAMTEVGLYTARNGMIKVADTILRGLAGMSGRASMESNAWDPAQRSIAQREFESSARDIVRQFVQPPKSLSFRNKAERRRIFRIVYPADTLRENGGHVDLEAIEAEVAKMVEHDPAQASRFFGNGLETGAGKAFELDRWQGLAILRPHVVPDGALITLGFDGSKRWDHASLIGTVVASGYQWPVGIWRPERYANHEVPAAEVSGAVDQAFETWDVWRLYADPPYWEDTVAGWSGKYGADRVAEWWTNRPRPMAYALRSWHEAQLGGSLSHCAVDDELCGTFSWHVGNAYRSETGYRDDEGPLWIVTKERTGSPDKIDSVPAAVLSWEARNDAVAAGALNLEVFESVWESRDPKEASLTL